MTLDAYHALEFQTAAQEAAATREPMRVMLLISNLKIGGAQEIVRTLAETLPKAGCPTIVCTFQDGELRAEIEKLGVPVEIIPPRRHSIVAFPLFLKDMWRIRQALLALVDRYQVQIIQTQLVRGLDFLVLSLRLSRKLLVFWTFHNALFVLRAEHLPRFRWLLGLKRQLHSLLYWLSAPYVHGFIAVSEDVKKAIHEYAGPLDEKVSVILNSVDVQRYRQPVDRAAIRQKLAVPTAAPVAAVVATFKEQKGHRFLIEAARTVTETYPDLRILFIGDGELKAELREKVLSLGLEKHILFLGMRTDVPELLGASDMFILPSLWEGLPMALIEAMACGLPVIATQVSGTKEVMLHEQTGLLVEPGNVQQLGDALARLLTNPDAAKTMGIAGQERVTQYFAAEKQAQAHVALYRDQWRKEFGKE